ncbi:MAG: DUF971 domain-containing protein [candidate division FCPU426 bacterium]
MRFFEGEIAIDGGIVEIRWDKGRVQRLSAPFLRSRCACANCKEVKFQLVPEMFPGLTVEHCDLVGRYAFQFHFSDGHKYGAYPYATLETYPDEA